MINLKNLRDNPSFYKKKYKERFVKNSDQLLDDIVSLDSSKTNFGKTTKITRREK